MGLLTKPNELTMKKTYVGLIYGQPGAGKSTLALSSVNPACIDVDKGMYRVEKRYQVPSLQVESYQQVLDLLNSDELDGFDTIVIDTLGKLVDHMAEYIGKTYPKLRQSNGQLTQQGWGQLKVEFHALVKLISGKNKSVIFVAHESEDKEGDVTKKRPDVSGSARKDIVKELDFMGYMEMSGNRRTISFSPSSAYYAKNSMGLDAVIEIPGIQAANSFIRDVIVSAIKNRREQDQAQAGPYNELIKKIDGLINAAKDIAAFNEAYEELAGLDHIWDSKLYAWSKITEAAKTINALWNKEKKCFTGPFIPVDGPPPKQEAPAELPSRPLTGTAPAPATPAPYNSLPASDKTGLVAHRKALGEDLIASMAKQNPDALYYFTDEERQSVKELLSKAGPHPQGIAIVQGLIDKWRQELQKREASFVPIPFDDVPADEGENREDLSREEMTSQEQADDGFVDDIPWEDGTPPGKQSRRTAGKLPGQRSLTQEFQDRVNGKSAKQETAGSGNELDIF
jgi:hypothetical protein